MTWSFVPGTKSIQLELITRDQIGDLVAEGINIAVRLGEAWVT
jgi:hypothetical protein